ncbi:MAG: hypothetical protein QW036_02750 [Zestosphaera sp.]
MRKLLRLGARLTISNAPRTSTAESREESVIRKVLKLGCVFIKS